MLIMFFVFIAVVTAGDPQVLIGLFTALGNCLTHSIQVVSKCYYKVVLKTSNWYTLKGGVCCFPRSAGYQNLNK